MVRDKTVIVVSSLLNHSSSSCVIEVGYEETINEEDMLDVSSAQIFRVPRLPPYSKDYLYNPHLVSIGPFHYGKKELQGMENSKSEAVRRMQKRIQRKSPHVSIKSIVEQHVLLKDNKIRKFYGERIPSTSTELAWMVVRDACFLYEFLVNYIKVGSNNQDTCEKQASWSDYVQSFYEEEVSAFKWTYDSVFDVDLQNPMRERLMTDLLLFENQIPIWILKDLLHFQMGSAEAAKQKVESLMNMFLWRNTRHEVFMWKAKLCYNMYSKKHLLEVVYRSMVGWNVIESPPSSQNHRQISSLEKGIDSMKAICGRVFNFSSNQSSSKRRWLISRQNLVNSAICRKDNRVLNKVDDDMVYLKLPTTSELVRGGVKIKPVLFEDVQMAVWQSATGLMDYFSAINWISFDDKTSTLYLPQFRVTMELHTVMGNFFAMEVVGIGGVKPITQFALLMEELIDNEDDVAVLRNSEVLNNFLGSNKQLAKIFNLAKGITHVPGCRSIDDVRMRLHKYTRRKYKKLWSEFVNAYFSKPWLVAGSTAAMLLILMTVVQVFCIFLTCNRIFS